MNANSSRVARAVGVASRLRPSTRRVTARTARLLKVPAGAAARVVATALALAALGAQAQMSALPTCQEVKAAPPVDISVGKSMVWQPPAPVVRIVLGNPEQAPAARGAAGKSRREAESRPTVERRPGVADVDVLLLAPTELVLQARTLGTTNLVLVDEQGRCTALDVRVGLDVSALQALVERLLPGERELRIASAFDSVVLTGSVGDSDALARVGELAEAFLRSQESREASGSGRRQRLVNLLEVGSPQQVMLEVKVAEVSKALIDKLGVQLSGSKTRGAWTYTLLADFLTGGGGIASLAKAGGSFALDIDAQKDDALVKVLAEPTVMALSGQTGSFLAGGKIFIPVAQEAGANGARTVTLEEKEFGVSLRFTPTVLGSGRIHLKVRPEVSELNREGVGIVASGVSGTAVLPSFSSRRAETTVQLMDGQSFAIGGLIRNNSTASVKAFPFLGELPVIGALFRSTQFQTDRSELVFVITPRLVKPLSVPVRLPTDGVVPPSRGDLMLQGRLEGGRAEEGAVRALQQSQTHDPSASQRGGQTVAPVDARLLPSPRPTAEHANPTSPAPGLPTPSLPPGERAP